MIDANKIAVSIASSINIKKLAFEDTFDERGSFECIFNAVLDRGITDFTVIFRSTTLAESRAIDMTNLANNNTLKSLDLSNSFSTCYTTEFNARFATQLVNILKINQSLEKLVIPPGMIKIKGRQNLLNSLKEENNSTLLELNTYYRIDDCDSIQLKINTEMKWNRIWKRYNTNYGLPAMVLSEKKKTTASLENEPLHKNKKKKEEKEEHEHEHEHGKKNISLVIYPILLEVLQNRPTHLYQFLQNENHRLSECYSSN